MSGSLLYSVINQEGETQTFALKPGGTSQFISLGELMYGQAISPDGAKILLNINDGSTYPPRDPKNIFIHDLETAEVSSLNLLNDPGSTLFWSDDGLSLLFVDRYSNEDYDQLVLYDLVSEENAVLITMDRIIRLGGWSQSGQRIAFVGEKGGQYDLFTIDSSTLEMQQLTNDTEVETLALWSPAAEQLLVGATSYDIFIHGDGPYGVYNLTLIDENNNSQNLLTTDRLLVSPSFSWSPNGQEIIYSDEGLLCLLNLGTMTENCPLAEVEPYNSYFASFWDGPVWSPDGEWLAFRANNETCHVIYFLEISTNVVVAGDLGCDYSRVTPLSPIYWSAVDFPKS